MTRQRADSCAYRDAAAHAEEQFCGSCGAPNTPFRVGPGGSTGQRGRSLRYVRIGHFPEEPLLRLLRHAGPPSPDRVGSANDHRATRAHVARSPWCGHRRPARRRQPALSPRMGTRMKRRATCTAVGIAVLVLLLSACSTGGASPVPRITEASTTTTSMASAGGQEPTTSPKPSSGGGGSTTDPPSSGSDSADSSAVAGSSTTATGSLTESNGQTVVVTLTLGPAVPVSEVDDDAVRLCLPMLSANGGTASNSVAVPLSVVAKSSAGAPFLVWVNPFYLVTLVAGSTATLSPKPLWADRDNRKPVCDPSRSGSGAGAELGDHSVTSPKAVPEYSAWIVFPGALLPDRQLTDAMSRAVLSPTVWSNDTHGTTFTLKNAPGGLVTCRSTNNPDLGYLAFNVDAAVAGGCWLGNSSEVTSTAVSTSGYAGGEGNFSGADPSSFGAFSTPTNNIMCGRAADQLMCFISQRDFAVGACDVGQPGFTIALKATGPATVSNCANDASTALKEQTQVVQYGATVEMGVARCAVSEQGVRCTNSDGHGFTLARSGHSEF